MVDAPSLCWIIVGLSYGNHIDHLISGNLPKKQWKIHQLLKISQDFSTNYGDFPPSYVRLPAGYKLVNKPFNCSYTYIYLPYLVPTTTMSFTSKSQQFCKETTNPLASLRHVHDEDRAAAHLLQQLAGHPLRILEAGGFSMKSPEKRLRNA